MPFTPTARTRRAHSVESFPGGHIAAVPLPRTQAPPSDPRCTVRRRLAPARPPLVSRRYSRHSLRYYQQGGVRHVRTPVPSMSFVEKSRLCGESRAAVPGVGFPSQVYVGEVWRCSPLTSGLKNPRKITRG